MRELQNDEYLRRFWRNCPDEVIDRMESQVFPAARGNRDLRATDAILWEVCHFPWYENASPSGRRQFHCLVGHVVRVARNYDVARTPDGRPIRLRSKRGPHKTFTLQVPRHRDS
jgi:hypothetical protein